MRQAGAPLAIAHRFVFGALLAPSTKMVNTALCAANRARSMPKDARNIG
jgi:hypothetical protein